MCACADSPSLCHLISPFARPLPASSPLPMPPNLVPAGGEFAKGAGVTCLTPTHSDSLYCVHPISPRGSHLLPSWSTWICKFAHLILSLKKLKQAAFPQSVLHFPSICLSIQLSFYPPIIHLCIYVHMYAYVYIISIYIFHEVVISQSCCCMRFVMLFYFICTCAFICIVGWSWTVGSNLLLHLLVYADPAMLLLTYYQFKQCLLRSGNCLFFLFV